MIRIEYKKTMGFGEFVRRFAIMCPTHIKKECGQDDECLFVIVQKPIDIYEIAIADAGHILSHPGTYLLKVTDIKIFEGTLS